jgi:hypothetical protein
MSVQNLITGGHSKIKNCFFKIITKGWWIIDKININIENNNFIKRQKGRVVLIIKTKISPKIVEHNKITISQQ